MRCLYLPGCLHFAGLDFTGFAVLFIITSLRMLAAVKEASGGVKDVHVLDLTTLCPTIVEIRNSSQRLMSVCMTGKMKYV
jgi:hypothetical protein